MTREWRINIVYSMGPRGDRLLDELGHEFPSTRSAGTRPNEFHHSPMEFRAQKVVHKLTTRLVTVDRLVLENQV